MLETEKYYEYKCLSNSAEDFLSRVYMKKASLKLRVLCKGIFECRLKRVKAGSSLS